MNLNMIKDKILDGVFGLMSKRSNLRCFLVLLLGGFIVFALTALFKNGVEEYYSMAPYWNEIIFAQLTRVNFVLLMINVIYYVIAAIVFMKYIFTTHNQMIH